ncbi:cell wall-binding repeat-containing protein [Planococcus dechangensis]|uniref:Cell wall-binding repeat-containing protein n=1 Tax=Planococcus dechangensis TaxID=1176255 RepID=A0ABV9MD14_9BACL
MNKFSRLMIVTAVLLSAFVLPLDTNGAQAAKNTFMEIVEIPAGGNNFRLEAFHDQIIASEETGSGYLRVKAYNKSGELNWQIPDQHDATHAISENRIIIISRTSGDMKYYSTLTGELIRTIYTGYRRDTRMSISSDYLLVRTNTGYTVWDMNGSVILSAGVRGMKAARIQGDKLVVQDQKSIQAFDLPTRKSIWTKPLTTTYVDGFIWALEDDTIYVEGRNDSTSRASIVTAFNADTGAVKYEKPLNMNVFSWLGLNQLGLHESNEPEDTYTFYDDKGNLKMTFITETPAIKQLKDKYFVDGVFVHDQTDWKFVEDGFYYYKRHAGVYEEYAFSTFKKFDMNGNLQFEKVFDDEYIFAMATTNSGKVFTVSGNAVGRYLYDHNWGRREYVGNTLSVYDSKGNLLETIDTKYFDQLKSDGSNLYGYGDETIYIFKESAAEPTKPTARISGTNRFDTAVAISKAGWKIADTVVLATSGDFPDALSGGPLAYQEDAPILLTRPEKLPHETKTEIERLKPKKAIVLGSQSAVSVEVEKELQRMGIEIERIGGKNRFDTAALIAQRLVSKEAVVAYGFNFPDVLSVSAYASKNGIPILLTRTDKLPAETEAALASTTKTHVIGSTGAVGQTVFNALPNPVRYGGANRYDTGLQVNSKLKMGTDKAFIATGLNFPDALAGSVLAAKNDAPILLVQRDSIPSATAKQLPDYNAYTIFGGTGVISRTLRDQLSTYGN